MVMVIGVNGTTSAQVGQWVDVEGCPGKDDSRKTQ